MRIAVIVNDIGEYVSRSVCILPRCLPILNMDADLLLGSVHRINVDASLIKSTHRITRTEEKVIALQNGCICCTLRQDLLSELVELFEKHAFDYIVIESSGSEDPALLTGLRCPLELIFGATVSEPAQVAESFDSTLSEHMYRVLKEQGELDANGALKKL